MKQLLVVSLVSLITVASAKACVKDTIPAAHLNERMHNFLGALDFMYSAYRPMLIEKGRVSDMYWVFEATRAEDSTSFHIMKLIDLMNMAVADLDPFPKKITVAVRVDQKVVRGDSYEIHHWKDQGDDGISLETKLSALEHLTNYPMTHKLDSAKREITFEIEFEPRWFPATYDRLNNIEISIGFLLAYFQKRNLFFRTAIFSVRSKGCQLDYNVINIKGERDGVFRVL